MGSIGIKESDIPVLQKGDRIPPKSFLEKAKNSVKSTWNSWFQKKAA